MSIEQRRIEPRPPAPVPGPAVGPIVRDATEEVINQLRTEYQRINSQRSPPLTGFAETLGPVRNNPAPETVPSYWIQILNRLQERYINQRTTNLSHVRVGGVNVYEDDRVISGLQIFANFPEYKRIQLDNNGFVVVPMFDAIKVMNLAKMLNSRIRRPLTTDEYFEDLKNAFADRKNQIIQAKEILDGAKSLSEEIQTLRIPENGPHLPGQQPRTIMVENVVRPSTPKTEGLNMQINRKIKLIKSMKKYPENSDLENYLLLSDFLSDRDVDRIWIMLGRKINNDNTENPPIAPVPSQPVAEPLVPPEQNKFKRITGAVNFEDESTMIFFKKKFRDTENLFMTQQRQIIKRRLLALFILISRNSTNTAEKRLNQEITLLFFRPAPAAAAPAASPAPIVPPSLSGEIVNIFINFIRGTVTEKYLNSVINGDFMNRIYKNEKIIRGKIIEQMIVANGNRDLQENARQQATKKEIKQSVSLVEKEKEEKKMFPLSEMLIRIRTKLWLTDDEINMLPLNYIFDKYSEEDRKTIMREKEICTEIAKLTNEFGNFPIPELILPDSLFVVKSNESNKGKVTDSSYFLERSGPNILKEIQRERRTRTYRGRSPSRTGGKRTRRARPASLN